MSRFDQEDPQVPAPARVVGTVMGVIFALIGVLVIGFLWTRTGFGAPPTFFKLFGTLVALGFVVIGGGMAFGAATGKGAHARPRRQRSRHSENGAGADEPASPGESAPRRGTPNLSCPQCGARAEDGSDISPDGDTRCDYCGTWFNIHS